MTVSVEDLRSLVNASATQDNVLDRCVAVAMELVGKYVAQATAEVPATIYDEAVLTVAADQFNRRQAPNGVVNQIYDGAAVPIRISRDPLAGVRDLLKPWVNTGLRSIRLVK